MMPLSRARGLFPFDCFDRDADACLRVNQPNPLSDIKLSCPAGQTMRRRVVAQFIQFKETSNVMRPNGRAADAGRQRPGVSGG
jgi:hypothetical protein